MTSIFNGRWPEMSSFNIFIKTYLFGLKQTNLCNSRKQFLLTAAEVHKYHSTEEKEKTRTPWTCTEHTGVYTAYRKEEEDIRIFQGLLYRIGINAERFVSLDFTVNYAGRTVFIYQTQNEALENYWMNIQFKLTILTMSYMKGIFYEL